MCIPCLSLWAHIGPSPNTAQTSPRPSRPQCGAVGATDLPIDSCFRGCAGNALWLDLGHQFLMRMHRFGNAQPGSQDRAL
eukprot:11220101-Lingulodinium_polyedra.AAC.1